MTHEHKQLTGGNTESMSGQKLQRIHLQVVCTFAMGAMNAEALPARARATQTDFMVDRLSVVT